MAQYDNKQEVIQFGMFTLDSQMFGVSILQMREIIRPVNLIKVPRAAGFVEGVINLRGSVIPIISLRAKFGMPLRAFDAETRIINMEIEDMVVGFIVDSIAHVRAVPAGAVEEPPAIVASVDAEYVEGVVKLDDSLLIVLDVGRLVSIDELKEFAGA